MPELTIVDLPSFKPDAKRHGGREGSDTMVAIDFTRKIVLICGSSYAGEMKKSVFTTLNFYLPAQGVMPMHCSANVGQDGDSALFFGLSGTGKTTLSADPNRTLIGDDEHGWGPDGIFNFEGGCYAKMHQALARGRAADLGRHQPLRRGAGERGVRSGDARSATTTTTPRPRTPARPIRSTSSRTPRAPAAPGIRRTSSSSPPTPIGVMPPIAKLTPAQAMYHFLSGYTAKVAGTEKGLVGVEPEFSTCFGAPFLPRPPSEYGNLLRDYIAKHKVDCWLVNSGWTGGIYGVGRRMPIKATRALRHRRARRLAEERRLPHRSLFRLLGADLGAGHRAASALSDEDLEGQGRVRRDRAQAGRHVPEELRQVREPRHADVRAAAPEVRIAAE